MKDKDSQIFKHTNHSSNSLCRTAVKKITYKNWCCYMWIFCLLENWIPSIKKTTGTRLNLLIFYEKNTAGSQALPCLTPTVYSSVMGTSGATSRTLNLKFSKWRKHLLYILYSNWTLAVFHGLRKSSLCVLSKKRDCLSFLSLGISHFSSILEIFLYFERNPSSFFQALQGLTVFSAFLEHFQLHHHSYPETTFHEVFAGAGPDAPNVSKANDGLHQSCVLHAWLQFFSSLTRKT